MTVMWQVRPADIAPGGSKLPLNHTHISLINQPHTHSIVIKSCKFSLIPINLQKLTV